MPEVVQLSFICVLSRSVRVDLSLDLQCSIIASIVINLLRKWVLAVIGLMYVLFKGEESSISVLKVNVLFTELDTGTESNSVVNGFIS